MNKHEVVNSIPDVQYADAIASVLRDRFTDDSFSITQDDDDSAYNIVMFIDRKMSDRDLELQVTRAQCFADGLVASIHHDIGVQNLRLRHTGFGVEVIGSPHAVHSALKALDSHMALRTFFNRTRDSVEECAKSIK